MRRLRDEDRGLALAAVIGLMLVGMILSTLILSSVINGISVTTTTSASVQSQAAAEAGEDYTFAQLTASTPTCAATYTSSSAPIFAVAVSTSSQTTFVNNPTTMGWTAGCPSSGTHFVRVVSTGTAAVAGTVQGQTAGNSREVETIYNYAPSTVSIPATGASVYTYSADSGSGLNNLDLTEGQSIATSVDIKSGSITCQSGTVITGDVVLANGNFSSSGGCKITGNLSVSGTATLNSGANVQGAVTASGASDTYADNTPVVSIYGTGPSGGDGKAVDGSVTAGGQYYISGAIGGSVTSTNYFSGSAASNASTVDPGSRISGNLNSAGPITTWGTRCTTPSNATGWDNVGNACATKAEGAVAGTVTWPTSGSTPPPIPSVPNWVHYVYKASDWTALGYNIVTWPGTAFPSADYCTVDNRTSLEAFATAVSSYTTPTVIDATGCPGELNLSNSANWHITMHTNIAFVGNGFHIGGLTATSSDSTAHDLWFITTDTSTGTGPTCPTSTPSSNSGDGVTLDTGDHITAPIAAMVYTPCSIADDSTTWIGQLYAQTVDFGANISLAYVPVGLPNVDLTAGTVTTTTTAPGSGNLGSVVRVRNVTPGT